MGAPDDAVFLFAGNKAALNADFTRILHDLQGGLGGPMTIGGLVFFGGTVFESKLRAYSADDGRKLWETDLPFSAHSVPGTYVWKEKRYVVVSAGGHGKVAGSRLGDAVIALAIE